LFGDRGEEARDISTWLIVVGELGWTTLGAGLLVGRYRRLAAV
jgi:hypothetical protein